MNATGTELQKLRSLGKRATSCQKAGCRPLQTVALSCMPTFFTYDRVAVPENSSVRNLHEKCIRIARGPTTIIRDRLSVEPLDGSLGASCCVRGSELTGGPQVVKGGISTLECQPSDVLYLTPAGTDAIEYGLPSADLRLPWSE